MRQRSTRREERPWRDPHDKPALPPTRSELVISGEIKEGEHEGVVRKRMRRTGRFEYRVTLPGQADPEQIDASLHDGVLNIRVPKSETAKARQIEVLAR